jgi:O-acetyl-ADP-ribose deacetylase (regulator of RNase III)
MKVIDGNILDSDSIFIAHQTNCVSETAGGVAAAIFNKWPQSNDYVRKTHGKFGTIKIYQVEREKYIINMYAQYYPGGQNFYPNDNAIKRLIAFRNCLDQIIDTISLICQQNNIKIPTISFPYMIGCGLAGGDWSKYFKSLQDFEKKFYIKCNGESNLYRLSV